MSINEAFGKVIVNLRKARNQSQEDFAWSIESERRKYIKIREFKEL